jgi:hypothetical protein
MKLYPTSKVWKGILFMWENPELIVKLKEQKFDDEGFIAKHIPQKDMDCVLRAINWAQAWQRKSK